MKREMEEEMQREFALIIKPPNQGRGFAGKNAKRFEIKTNFGAILHDVVKSAYEKHQGKEPERGFFLKKEHVTSARILAERSSQIVKDFVVKCGALNSEYLECTMNYDDRPGDRQARRNRKKEKTWKPRLEETKAKEVARLQLEEAIVETRASKKRKLAKGAQTGAALGCLCPRQRRCIWRRKHHTGRHTRCPRRRWLRPGRLQRPSCAWMLVKERSTAVCQTLGIASGRLTCARLRIQQRAIQYFQPMHPHHHRRTDKDHQWCLSLGEFTAGEFCWQERDQCFSVSTKD